MTVLITVLVIHSVSAENVWVDGFEYYLSDDNKQAYVTDLSAQNKNAEEWVFPEFINYQNTQYSVTKFQLNVLCPNVKRIKAPSFIENDAYYENLPNLESYIIIDTGSGNYYTDNDMVYWRVDYWPDDIPSQFVFLPPAKNIETLRIDGDCWPLLGNRYLKKIIIGALGGVSKMNSNNFPELEEFELDGESDSGMRLYDGGLYWACENRGTENERTRLVGYPLKRSDICIVHESSYFPIPVPNVKTVIINSPHATMGSTKFGDKIENIIFTKPASNPKSWKLYNIAPGQLKPKISITGKNLKRVELPENVTFSPYIFSEFKFQYSTDNDRKRYYTVSFSPKLEYVKGGSLGYAYTNYDWHYLLYKVNGNEGWVSGDFYLLESESSIFDQRFVAPKRSMEIHVKKPSDEAYHELNELPETFEIYYDTPIEALNQYISQCAAGLSVKTGDKIKDLSDLSGLLASFSRLKELNIYFTDDFGGLGNSHLCDIFTNGYSSNINQYVEDGSVVSGFVPKGLKKVGFYGSLSFIPYGYFSNLMSLESLSLPETTISIADRALYGCSMLKELNVYATYPPVVYPETFIGVRKQFVRLSVPETGENLYRRDASWKDFFFTDTNNGYLTVRKTIQRGGEVSVDFDGILGSIAHITANPSDGYRFVCWLDDNGFYLSQSLQIEKEITAPCLLTAVFMPTESSNLEFSGENDGTLHIALAPIEDATRYRASAYTGDINGIPVATVTTMSNATLSTRNNTSSKTEITLRGLDPYRTYSILVEALDSQGQCIEALLGKTNVSSAGIIENTCTPDYSVYNGTLRFNRNATVTVHNIYGICFYNGHADTSSEVNLSPGIYVLNIDGKAYKILVQ